LSESNLSSLPQRLDLQSLERLKIYYDLLLKWQKTVNLVGPRTLDQFWDRHLLDSLQLLTLIRKFTTDNPQTTIADLGTGAGIPGLLLALAGVENMTLVESDIRKSGFLREVARVTEVKITLENNRIEKIVGKDFDVILARALAPLPKLFDLAHPISKEDTTFIFPKGIKAEEEINDSKTGWQFSCLRHKSLSDDSGLILEISNLKPQQGNSVNG